MKTINTAFINRVGPFLSGVGPFVGKLNVNTSVMQ